jgi:hypothetical protein
VDNGTVSDSTTGPVRPPQVTVAAWMIMVGSVFVVLMVWDRIAGLHSLDSQTTLRSMLDNPGIKGSGLGVGDLETIVRTVSMVAGGCATAMVILGYQTLHRSRSARIGLTVLAGPLFVSGLVTGGFVSSGVAAAVGTLWLRPARLWFDGQTAKGRRDASSPASRSQSSPAWPPPYPPPAPPPSGSQQAAAPSAPATARPWEDFGSVPAEWAPPPLSSYDARPAAHAGSRPAALLWACVLTWVFAGLAVVVLAGSIAVLVGSPHLVLDKMHEQNPQLASQGVSDHLVVVVGFVMCGLFVMWSLAAVVFALLAFRRRRLGWQALTASTGGVALVCLLGVIGSLVVLVPLAGAVAAITLLVRPEVRAWFA